jgi:hypothetical protein
MLSSVTNFWGQTSQFLTMVMLFGTSYRPEDIDELKID